MKVKCLFYIMGLGLLTFSCMEKTLDPISGSEGKPGTITLIGEPERIPGGAVISYLTPDDKDILSVKACYTLTNGRKRESECSYYGSRLTIEGYNDTLVHEAQIYTINRAQEKSDPVTVSFQPLKSPLAKVLESFQIISDFGGANFSWENEDGVPMLFEFYAEDQYGELQITGVVSSSDSSAYIVRGYTPEPHKFGAVVADIYDNISEMILPEGGSLIPIPEIKLDKSKMAIQILNTDVQFNAYEGENANLIDDNLTTFGHTYGEWPASFTLDIGKKAKLSRIITWQRNDYQPSLFASANLKTFEVYACADIPSQSGVWSEWEKIMECSIIKPSGLPVGTLSDDDILAIEAGHEFSFPISMEPTRYLRILLTGTWGGVNWFHPAEFTLYGDYVE